MGDLNFHLGHRPLRHHHVFKNTAIVGKGYQVRTMESVVWESDIFTLATGKFDLTILEHMKETKTNAIVCNIGLDNEVDLEGLEEIPGINVENIKPQGDRFVSPDGHGAKILASGRWLNSGCATGHQSSEMTWPFTKQVLAQLDILKNWKETQACESEVYPPPTALDEKTAGLRSPTMGAEMTKLTKAQVDHVCLKTEGFKGDTYKYCAPISAMCIWMASATRS